MGPCAREKRGEKPQAALKAAREKRPTTGKRAPPLKNANQKRVIRKKAPFIGLHQQNLIFKSALKKGGLKNLKVRLPENLTLPLKKFKPGANFLPEKSGGRKLPETFT